MENLLDVARLFFETQKAQKFTKGFHKSLLIFNVFVFYKKNFCENPL